LKQATEIGKALPTRERQRLETRNVILRAALAEIARVGLADAQIGRIARRAGVTRPTIYAHFPKKEDFLRAVREQTEAHALRQLERQTGEASGAQQVHRFADAMLDMVDRADPVLRNETFAVIIRERSEREWVGEALHHFVSARLEEAQTAGEIRTDIPTPELTRIVITAMFGFLIMETDPADERRRAAHQMLDLLIGAAG